MHKIQYILKAVYHIMLAFPKFFGKAFYFIPYFGTIIAFLPDFLDMAKVIREELKDKKHDEVKKKLNIAKLKLKDKDRSTRLDGLDEIDNVVDSRFVD